MKALQQEREEDTIPKRTMWRAGIEQNSTLFRVACESFVLGLRERESRGVSECQFLFKIKRETLGGLWSEF